MAVHSVSSWRVVAPTGRRRKISKVEEENKNSSTVFTPHFSRMDTRCIGMEGTQAVRRMGVQQKPTEQSVLGS
jgi:hypothetical protein